MEKKLKIKWWQYILLIDTFLIAVTILHHYVYFPGSWLIARAFNLSVEMNFGVWWSGISLFALAALSYELACLKKGTLKLAWSGFAILFVCLSLDEIGSIHERVGGWSDLLPYGVCILGLLTFILVFLFQKKESRKAAFFFTLGFFLFGTVALQEYLGDVLAWPVWAKGLRSGLEEGTELLGTFCIFWGIVGQRCRGRVDSFRAVVPNPSAMKNGPILLAAGLFMHLLASIWVPGLTNLENGGNPLVWYLVAVLFLLFAHFFWHCSAVNPENTITFSVTPYFFLSCSALANMRIPQIDQSLVVMSISGFVFFVVFILLSSDYMKGLYFILIGLIFTIAVTMDLVTFRYILSGLLVFYAAIFFIKNQTALVEFSMVSANLRG